MELSNWVEARGSADFADNVRSTLNTIDKNEEFIKLTLSVLMTPESSFCHRNRLRDRLDGHHLEISELLLFSLILRLLFRDKRTQGVRIINKHFYVTFKVPGNVQHHPELLRERFDKGAGL